MKAVATAMRPLILTGFAISGESAQMSKMRPDTTPLNTRGRSSNMRNGLMRSTTHRSSKKKHKFSTFTARDFREAKKQFAETNSKYKTPCEKRSKHCINNPENIKPGARKSQTEQCRNFKV